MSGEEPNVYEQSLKEYEEGKAARRAAMLDDDSLYRDYALYFQEQDARRALQGCGDDDVR
jgi:hypothetical protein